MQPNELDDPNGNSPTDQTDAYWRDWWRRKGWAAASVELASYIDRGFLPWTEAQDELRSMALYGTGLPIDEWLGLLCVLAEMWFDSDRLLFMLGDEGFAGFRATHGGEERLVAARRIFPGVGRCLQLIDEYYDRLNEDH